MEHSPTPVPARIPSKRRILDQSQKRETMYKTTITPRFNETDAVGHINNTKFPAWFEAARRDFFAEFDPDLATDPWTLLVVRYELNFLKEVNWVPEVTIHTSISRLGRTSVTLHEELYQEGELCVVSEVTYVNVDPRTRRPEAVPNPVREKLSAHLSTKRNEYNQEGASDA
ncbi:acyl-CoA thioesterase [Corynebacterium hiratae]|uniref:Acyl-CoA thioesterase n=2 Tax=Corynebacterium hiratae TaxID=3139423 RepID=A0A553G1R4_9CORY|nr:acyl-CoA thioesterase [Corynebacterium aurimucosum]